MELIAETAWHHEGDFGFFKNLINTIAKLTKTDYIKLHITLDFDEYMSKNHPFYTTGKKWIFNKKQWKEIIDIIIQAQKKIVLLYNDRKAVDFGTQFNPDLIEIHSTCLNDINLIKEIKAKVEKDTGIILGIGGSSLYEIDHTINFLKHDNIVLMHGFQNFPTKLSDINIRKIRKIVSLYPEFKHGYADHTAWDNQNNILISLFGATQNMEYLEKHVTIVPGQKRTDWVSAISIKTFNHLHDKFNLFKECLGSGELSLNNAEKIYSVLGPMKKAPVLNADIKKFDSLKLDMIDFKRTSGESNLSFLESLNYVGKKMSGDFKKGHLLMREDFIDNAK